MNKMTVTVPAKAEWTLVLRMAVSGVGAVFDLPLDVMDDLKTALDESAELLMHQPYCVSHLTLECKADQNGIHVSLTAERCAKKQDDETADADIAGLIIGTLVKEVRLARDEGGVSGVHMLLPAQTHGC